MHYVYVLKSKEDNEFYYGYTSNLERCIQEHNKDKNYELVYFEAYKSDLDARERERKLKNYGQTRTHLKNRIKRSLDSKN